jgi:hypothetical protein
MQINPKRQILAGELLISSALGSYQKIHGWCVSLLWRAANSCMHAAAVVVVASAPAAPPCDVYRFT